MLEKKGKIKRNHIFICTHTHIHIDEKKDSNLHSLSLHA
jgi:hypothetical protein